MIEFLSNYGGTVGIVTLTVTGFCILWCYFCVGVFRYGTVIGKLLAVIGMIVGLAIPIGLCAVNDKIHNYKQSRTCIYINHKTAGFGIGEIDYEFID